MQNANNSYLIKRQRCRASFLFRFPFFRSFAEHLHIPFVCTQFLSSNQNLVLLLESSKLLLIFSLLFCSKNQHSGAFWCAIWELECHIAHARVRIVFILIVMGVGVVVVVVHLCDLYTCAMCMLKSAAHMIQLHVFGRFDVAGVAVAGICLLITVYR